MGGKEGRVMHHDEVRRMSKGRRGHQRLQRDATAQHLSSLTLIFLMLPLQGVWMSRCIEGTLKTIPLPLLKLEWYWCKVGRVNASLPFPEPPLIPREKVGQQHNNQCLLSLLTSVAGMVCLLPRGASKKNCSLAPVLTWSSFPVNEKAPWRLTVF